MVIDILLDPIILEQVDIRDWARWKNTNFLVFALSDRRFDMFVRGLRDFILQEALPLVEPL